MFHGLLHVLITTQGTGSTGAQNRSAASSNMLSSVEMFLTHWQHLAGLSTAPLVNIMIAPCEQCGGIAGFWQARPFGADPGSAVVPLASWVHPTSILHSEASCIAVHAIITDLVRMQMLKLSRQRRRVNLTVRHSIRSN